MTTEHPDLQSLSPFEALARRAKGMSRRAAQIWPTSAERLATTRDLDRLISADFASAQLDMTPEAFIPEAIANGWTIYSFRGAPYVSRIRLDAAELERGMAQFDSDEAARDQALTMTLRELLAANPATGDWTEAREQHRPLICARRGQATRWRNGGIEYHTVAVDTRWLIHWAGHLDDRTDPAAQHIRRWMPVRDPDVQLHVARVEGVDPISGVTPLSKTSAGKVVGARSVDRWIKIDLRHFEPRVEEPWLPLVDAPWDHR